MYKCQNGKEQQAGGAKTFPEAVPFIISSSNKNNIHIYIYLTASGKVFAPPGGCSLGVVAVAVFCFFVVAVVV